MITTPISQFPRGLLGLFDIKSQGEYPKHISSEIGISFDISTLQLQTNSEFLFDNTLILNGAGTAGAGTYTFTGAVDAVPSNEVWIVSQCRTMLEILGVGAQASMPMVGFNHPGVTGVAGFVPLSHSLTPIGVWAGLASPSYQTGAQDLSTPIVLPPGALLLYLLNEDATGVAGGHVRFRGYLRFLRCRI